MSQTVLIIGGGAAGMLAALTALELSLIHI